MKTWTMIQNDASIDCIEHPITSFLMPKSEFAAEFHLFLAEMDGTTSADYFDFYFERCRIIKSAFRFKDDDAKEDFIDACIELGLLPTFRETLEGENKSDKLLRQNKSSADLVDDFKSLKTKEMVKKYNSNPDTEDRSKYRSKAQQLHITFHKLQASLEACDDAEKKKQLESKLARVMSMMEHTV